MRTIRRSDGLPRRRVWAWVLAGVTAVAMIIACGGGDGGVEPEAGGDKEDKTADTDKEAEVAKIGEPARDGKFEFTVTKVDRGKTTVGDEYADQKAQGEFIFIHVTVKNIAKEPQTFFGDDQKLISADGKQFSADSEAAIYLDESQSLLEEINPGNQVNGIVIFDVPKGTKLAKVELHDSAYSGGVAVAL